jgi:hypothetical protein
VNVSENEQIPFWSGAVGRVSGIGRTVTELLLKQDMAVRAMVRNEDERAQHMSAEVVVGDLFDPIDAGPLRNARYSEPLAVEEPKAPGTGLPLRVVWEIGGLTGKVTDEQYTDDHSC